MDRVQNTSHIPGWDTNNIFEGTARYYARYRPEYPAKAIQQLADEFQLNNKSRVLDLGCGTGQIALKLAPLTASVIAIDPQESMLKEGQRLAKRRKIHNITWLKGESKDLLSISETIGEVDLTVIARAFHWMDRTQTLADLYRITAKGGGVATVGDTLPMYRDELPWVKIIDTTIKDWLGATRKAGTKGVFNVVPKKHQDYLRESGFTDIKTVQVKTRRKWSVARIIGFIYSTSAASVPVLGDKKEPFEKDLKKRLLTYDPSGVFTEPAVTEINTARKLD